jgi:hypothetical protein
MGVEGLREYEGLVLNRISEQAADIIKAQKIEVGLACMEKGIDLTPVNLGEARAGWHASDTRPTNENRKVDDPLSSVVEAANSGAAEDALYIQNFVPHMVVIDNGTFEPPDPGPSKATHVPLSRRHLVRGEILVRGGYSVSAPRGITEDVLDTVAAQFGLERIRGV